MKRLLALCTAVLLMANVFAQVPQKMSYQAVIRNSNNAIVASATVGMKISILQGSANGTAVYVETQSPITNANGLASLQIGTGTVVSGVFANINWANGTYFIKTETDPTGGANYTITGTSQLVSVPYALHAETVTGGVAGTKDGDMQYWKGNKWIIIPATSNEGATLQMINGVPTWTGGMPPPQIPSVTSTTGKVWMDRNLGATQVATSSTDAASYGDLYQWGRGTDGHEKRNSATTTTLSITDTPGHGYFITRTTSLDYNWRSTQNDNLWQGVNGVNNPCPSGYRVPTNAELEAEIVTWSSKNAAGAFASPLKLTVAGNRNGWNNDGVLMEVGYTGLYWSSTFNNTASCDSHYLLFGSNDAYTYGYGPRLYGRSIRCIKD